MKILSILLFSLLMLPKEDWHNDLNMAIKEAKENNKLILINFSGSDWCGPCRQMHKEIFDSDVFQQYAKANLVLLNADFPRSKKNQLSVVQQSKNDKLADKYNPDGIFPLTVLIDVNGKILKQWEGFPDLTPKQFVSEVSHFTHAKK